jgi:hypothetical protein
MSDYMKHLILSYMEACNSNDKVKEEAIIAAIKKEGKTYEQKSHN